MKILKRILNREKRKVIKLIDILKEATSDPLAIFKDRLRMGIFSWDKYRKKAGLDFLNTALTNKGATKGIDVIAKDLYGKPYGKLEYEQRSVCIDKALEEVTDTASAVEALKQLRVGPITSSPEQRYIDSFIRYLEQPITESKNPHQYKIMGILITNTEKRAQGDILSDMRSIPGVTIVTPKDYHGGDNPINNRRYTVELSVKIDPHPFPTFGKEQIRGILDQIKRVDGVVRYTPNKIVKRIV